MRSLRFPLLLLLCTVTPGWADEPEPHLRVTPHKGAAVTGALRPKLADRPVVRLRGPRRDWTFSPGAIADRARAEPLPEWPRFRFAAGPQTRRQGRLARQPLAFRWEGPFTAAGLRTAQLKDPQHGKLTVRYRVREIDPLTIRLQPDGWAGELQLPTAEHPKLIAGLLEPSLSRLDAAVALRAARFYRLTGDLAAAARWVDQLAGLQADHPALGGERLALERERLGLAMRTIARQARAGRVAEAARLAASLQIPFVLQAQDKPLAEAAARLQRALAARLARRDQVKAWLVARRGPLAAPWDALGIPAAERLGLACGLAADGTTDRLNPPRELLSELIRPWARQLATATGDRLAVARAAIALRTRVARLLGSQRSKPPQTETRMLAKALEESELPLSLKLALVADARDPAGEAASGTHDVKLGRISLRYRLSLPDHYDPRERWPLLLWLGPGGAAEPLAYARWQAACQRHGLVLVSPVADQPRSWHHAEADHAPVLALLDHACRTLAIDRDRVILAGSEAGGDAAWDLGAAWSGRFAGVAPINGEPIDAGVVTGLSNTALFAVGGDAASARHKRIRQVLFDLAALETDARYLAYRGRDGDPLPTAVEPVVRWASQQRRASSPHQLAVHARRRCDTRCRWLELAVSHLPARLTRDQGAQVGARYDPEKHLIAITASDLRGLAVLVDPAMIDLDEPLYITINGQRRHSKRVEIDWALLLRRAFADEDAGALVATRIAMKVPTGPPRKWRHPADRLKQGLR